MAHQVLQTRISTRGIRPLSARKRKPIVVFDMSFLNPKNRASRREFYRIVSGAAQGLAAALRKHKAATPFFLSAPLVQQNGSGRISFPKEWNAANRPLIFALSLYDYLFKETQAEVKAIKMAYPNARIIIGGPSVNTCKNLTELASFFPEADALVRGDGEPIITPLVKALSGNPVDINAVAKLKGVYVKSNGYVYRDEGINLLSEEEFNAQPGLTAYPALVQGIEKTGELVLHTSRGCKYRCIFCSDKYHPRPIYWSAKRITQELQRIREMIKKGILPQEARRINFSDDDFFQNTERAIEFLQIVAGDPSLKNFFSFDFQGSVGSFFREGRLNSKLLDLLTQVKTGYITLGTDGFHPITLRYLRKGGYKWEMVQELTKALHQRNILQQHYVILTYPGITRQMLIETLENMMELLVNYGANIGGFNATMTVSESNALSDIFTSYPQRYTVQSETGIEKRLPFIMPLIDRDLAKELHLFLRLPLPDKRSLAKAIKLARSRWGRNREWKYMKKLARFFRRVNNKGRFGSLLKVENNNTVMHFAVQTLLDKIIDSEAS